MPKITLPSGRTFEILQGQSLLAAAEVAGVRLPYSCMKGRCSSCRCKIDGKSIALMDEIGLSAEERAEGWVLACARSPVESLSVDIQELTDLQLAPPRLVATKIDSLEKLSQSVLRVRLRTPPGTVFGFAPGQYIDVVGPNGIRRSYSLANGTGSGRLELHVRYVKDGEMSSYWFERAQLNDLLRIEGPKGTFILRHNPGDRVVFLATGTGMAPIKSMLEEIAALPKLKRPQSVSVYWGGRTPEDLYWDPREAFHDALYVPTLSRAEGEWTGMRGYIQNALLNTVGAWDNVQVYACGSNKMVQGARKALTGAGLRNESFYCDAFVASS